MNHVKLFQSIIDSNDTYNEINNFFDIVEKLSEIMIKIGDDKYGRLLNYNPKICLNWEAYMCSQCHDLLRDRTDILQV